MTIILDLEQEFSGRHPMKETVVLLFCPIVDVLLFDCLMFFLTAGCNQPAWYSQQCHPGEEN